MSIHFGAVASAYWTLHKSSRVSRNEALRAMRTHVSETAISPAALLVDSFSSLELWCIRVAWKIREANVARDEICVYI